MISSGQDSIGVVPVSVEHFNVLNFLNFRDKNGGIKLMTRRNFDQPYFKKIISYSECHGHNANGGKKLNGELAS